MQLTHSKKLSFLHADASWWLCGFPPCFLFVFFQWILSTERVAQTAHESCEEWQFGRQAGAVGRATDGRSHWISPECDDVADRRRPIDILANKFEHSDTTGHSGITVLNLAESPFRDLVEGSGVTRLGASSVLRGRTFGRKVSFLRPLMDTQAKRLCEFAQKHTQFE